MANAYLTLADVCRIGGECRAELRGKPIEEALPLSAGYVRQLVSYARGTRTTPGPAAARLAHIPLPDADAPALIWSPKGREGKAGVIRRMRHYFLNERPGQGAGGGPKPQDGVQTVLAKRRKTQGSGRKR